MNPLIIIGLILIIAGIAGCIFPTIPGLILSYGALILLSIAYRWEPFSVSLLIILGTAVCGVTALDFLVPRWREKKYGASKPGVLIAVIVMLIGLWLLPPWGIVIGAFVGGLTGEIIARKRPGSAFRAGAGVFIGTIFGIMLKVCVTGVIVHCFFSALILWDSVETYNCISYLFTALLRLDSRSHVLYLYYFFLTG